LNGDAWQGGRELRCECVRSGFRCGREESEEFPAGHVPVDGIDKTVGDEYCWRWRLGGVKLWLLQARSASLSMTTGAPNGVLRPQLLASGFFS
jgi:hypothetical protein